MGLFNKVSEFVNTKGKDLDKSLKTFAAASKIQGGITEKEDQIADALKTIGQLYFDAHKEDPDAEYAQYIKIIISAREEIEKNKKELDVLKGIQRCPKCGEEVSVEAKFCPKCGEKMPEVPVVSIEEPASVQETVAEAEAVAEEMEAVVEAVETVEAEKVETEE